MLTEMSKLLAGQTGSCEDMLALESTMHQKERQLNLVKPKIILLMKQS